MKRLTYAAVVGLLAITLSPSIKADETDANNRVPVGAAVFGGVETPAKLPNRKIANQKTDAGTEGDALDADSGVDQHPLQQSDDFFKRSK